VGETFRNILGDVTVLAVEAPLLGPARVKMAVRDQQGFLRVGWHPLTVRWMHPAFMFRKVGFIQS